MTVPISGSLTLLCQNQEWEASCARGSWSLGLPGTPIVHPLLFSICLGGIGGLWHLVVST